MSVSENSFVSTSATNGINLMQNPPAIPEENAKTGGFASQEKIGAPTMNTENRTNSSQNPEFRDSSGPAPRFNSDAKPSPDQLLFLALMRLNSHPVQEFLTVAATQHVPAAECGGRPQVLDVQLRFKICQLLKLGYSRSLVAAELKVHRTTIARTMKRDAEFRRQVLEAEELFERSPLLTVLAEAQHNWRAAIWLMKNYQPHESVKRRKHRKKIRVGKRETREETRAMEEALSFSTECADELAKQRKQKATDRERLEELKQMMAAKKRGGKK